MIRIAGIVIVLIPAASMVPVAIACIITGGWESFRHAISPIMQKKPTTGQ